MQKKKKGIPKLDERSYVERIAYRMKKWNNVEIEEQKWEEHDMKRKHEVSLCEGCKTGHCSAVDYEIESD